ncbi:hypothetical protein ACLBXB_21810 [Methylobacterium mesophilicum]
MWGSHNKFDDLPVMGGAENALYLPEDETGTWGLFSRGEQVYYKDAGKPETIYDGTFDNIEYAPEGKYLYVGLFVLHYGHFLIDTLSHFWPLLSKFGARPKILCHRLSTPPGGIEHAALYEVLAGLGIRREDVISYDRPIRIAHVITAEVSFCERSHVHSIFGDLCRNIGRRYWSQKAVDSISRPVYLSKSKLQSGIALACLLKSGPP